MLFPADFLPDLKTNRMTPWDFAPSSRYVRTYNVSYGFPNFVKSPLHEHKILRDRNLNPGEGMGEGGGRGYISPIPSPRAPLDACLRQQQQLKLTTKVGYAFFYKHPPTRLHRESKACPMDYLPPGSYDYAHA